MADGDKVPCEPLVFAPDDTVFDMVDDGAVLV